MTLNDFDPMTTKCNALNGLFARVCDSPKLLVYEITTKAGASCASFMCV